MPQHILLIFSVMFLPNSLQFYLKTQSHPMTEEQKWGLSIISNKEENINQLEILRSLISNEISLANLSQKKLREADDVHFSITNSLDVLRERMLGAIRRNNRKTEVFCINISNLTTNLQLISRKILPVVGQSSILMASMLLVNNHLLCLSSTWRMVEKSPVDRVVIVINVLTPGEKILKE